MLHHRKCIKVILRRLLELDAVLQIQMTAIRSSNVTCWQGLISYSRYEDMARTQSELELHFLRGL